MFEVRGTDKRRELLNAYERGEETFYSQKTGGKDVEIFTPETGFVLVKQLVENKTELEWMKQARSCAELSLGPVLELREFYYTMRGKPELVEPFKGENIYVGVLNAINNLEMLCDIGRETFTVGNLPKGFVHYGHDWNYGQAEKPIGFTENIARRVLSEWEVTHALNIIHMEKSAAATRLVAMDFSKLTNSIISTTGGNFTRAVYALANRFKGKKNIIFFTDGDAFGQDMLRSVEFGTIASRHLTPQQAFPTRTNPSIYKAGLFPSVAEKLEIPNDVEQKRPMSNENVKKRVEFLKRWDVADNRDIDTWERDKTYELEALSTSFRNNENKPVGLGIYLTEYMRLNNIPCKPKLTDDDDRVMEEFRRTAKEELKTEIREEVNRENPTEDLTAMITDKIGEVVDEIADEIYNDNIDGLEDELDNITADDLREQVAKQYQDTPKREVFSLREIARTLKKRVDVEVNWDAEELKKRIEETVQNYIDELRSRGGLYSERLEFDNLPDVGELKDFYDVVEEQIGARKEDVEAVREALRWRLSYE